MENDIFTAKQLIAHGANINEILPEGGYFYYGFGMTLMTDKIKTLGHLCAAKNDITTARELLARGHNFEDDVFTPLHLSVFYAGLSGRATSLPFIKFLVEEAKVDVKAKVNLPQRYRRPKNGMTALDIAKADHQPESKEMKDIYNYLCEMWHPEMSEDKMGNKEGCA